VGKGREFFVGGNPGECVFTEPFHDWANPSPGEKLALPAVLNRIQSTGDDRSFVLLSAVVVERYAEELMKIIAPGFASLAAKRDFTASLKVEVLRSLRLIPPHILHAADLIRKVRNEFAHDLNVETFSDCKESYVESLHRLAVETFGDKDPSRSHREAFRDVTFIALAGLQAYRSNFRKLRQKLTDLSVIEQWKKESVMEFLAIVEFHRAANAAGS
jgi:hypothetical protein